MGIADQIRDGLMILEGLSKEEASKRFYCVDRNGLLVESMGNGLRHAQMAYARDDEEVADWPRANPEQNALRLKDGEHPRHPSHSLMSANRNSGQGCQAYRAHRDKYALEGIRRGDREGDGQSRRQAHHREYIYRASTWNALTLCSSQCPTLPLYVRSTQVSSHRHWSGSLRAEC